MGNLGLSKILEIVSLQYFVLRKYDFRLLKIQERIIHKISVWRLFYLTKNLKLISNERQQILLDVHDYWNIKVAKRTYVQKLFEDAKKTFLLDNLFASIQHRIESLDELLNNTYQVYMVFTNTVIALIVLALTTFTLVCSDTFSKMKDSSNSITGNPAQIASKRTILNEPNTTHDPNNTERHIENAE